MTKQGPEAKLITKMRKTAREHYGDRLVDIKYHGDIYAEAGVSDLLHSLDGIFVAIEVKAPDNYKVRGEPNVEKAIEKGPTVKQRLFVDRVNRSGGIGGFAASVEGYMDLLLLAELLHKDRTDG